MIDVFSLIHITGKPRAIVEATNWIKANVESNPDFQYAVTPTVLTETLCWQILLARGTQDDFDWLLLKGIVTERDRRIWNDVMKIFTVTSSDVLVEELEDAE